MSEENGWLRIKIPYEEENKILNLFENESIFYRLFWDVTTCSLKRIAVHT